MLRLTNRQIDRLAENCSDRFVSETVAFLRKRRSDWSKALSDAEIAAHISEVKRFANAHNIYNAASLQRLALMKIDKEFDGALEEFAKMFLSAKGWSEARRIAEFDAARNAGQKLTPIKLAGKPG